MTPTHRRLTGAGLLLGALLINVPFALLGAKFEYPAVLRAPPGEVLTRVHAGGAGLIALWLAFAWVGLPMMLAIARAPRALPEVPHVRLASTLGVVAMVVQMVGLLRWVFVVPVLARIYVDAGQDPATRAAAVVVFRAVHQFGGVLLGEHLGMAFTSLWMGVLSVGILRSDSLPRWIGALGVTAAGAYSLVHGDLLATALPGFPHWRLAGLAGSLLWLAWSVALGAAMMRPARGAA